MTEKKSHEGAALGGMGVVKSTAQPLAVGAGTGSVLPGPFQLPGLPAAPVKPSGPGKGAPKLAPSTGKVLQPGERLPGAGRKKAEGPRELTEAEKDFCVFVAAGNTPVDFFKDDPQAISKAADLIQRLDVNAYIEAVQAVTMKTLAVTKETLVGYHLRRMLNPTIGAGNRDLAAKEVKELMGFNGDDKSGVKILLNVQMGNGRTITTAVSGPRGELKEIENDDGGNTDVAGANDLPAELGAGAGDQGDQHEPAGAGERGPHE